MITQCISWEVLEPAEFPHSCVHILLNKWNSAITENTYDLCSRLHNEPATHFTNDFSATNSTVSFSRPNTTEILAHYGITAMTLWREQKWSDLMGRGWIKTEQISY